MSNMYKMNNNCICASVLALPSESSAAFVSMSSPVRGSLLLAFVPCRPCPWGRAQVTIS